MEWTNGSSDGGCSFTVKQGSIAAEVTSMYEAGAKEFGDVIRDEDIWTKRNAKILF